MPRRPFPGRNVCTVNDSLRPAPASSRTGYANVQSTAESPVFTSHRAHSRPPSEVRSDAPLRVHRLHTRINDGVGSETLLCGGGTPEPLRGRRSAPYAQGEACRSNSKGPIRSTEAGATTASRDYAMANT